MEHEVHRRYLRRKAFIFAVLFALAVLFWSSVELQKIFYDFILFSSRYLDEQKFLGAVFFLAVSALSAVLSPFSSVPFLPVFTVIWGNVLTVDLLLLGWLLGGVASYFLGSLTGYSLAKKLFPPEKVEYYKQEISTRTKFPIVLLFRLAMPTEIAGYVLGSVKYSFIKYLIITALAETPFAFIAVYSSEALIEANKANFVFLIFLLSLIIAAAFFLFKRIHKNNLLKS